MKLKTTLLMLMFSVAALAQFTTEAIPTGYYNSATGTGYTLKNQLRTIITNGHNPQSYTTGLWNLYSTSLRDNFYENDGSLLDIYSENPTGIDPYNYTSTSQQCGNYTTEGQCYNKEHLIPQAYFGNGAMPMYSDAHHVVPSDGKVNGWRDNLPFGVVSGTVTNGCNAGATNTPCKTLNNSKIGNNLNSGYSSGFSGKVFEPIDEFKGDIARTFFYFATRYQDDMDDFYSAAANTLEVKAMFDGSTNKVFSTTFLNIMLTWHANDPVSPKEVAFNNAIYNFQGNRNPFIDHPEYVQSIWGTPAGTDTFDISTKVAVYPNPATSNTVNISSEVEITSLRLININGQIVSSIQNPVPDSGSVTLSNLPQGFYILTINTAEGSAVKKVLVN
ncbi:endonuclease [Flavobacterium sp. J372]|uniref:endonuclease n=1 Tax=Flavobacterium sp. J372 TaxID=2898436 RepID=UPI002150F104|nr:endonuclease [Flavobacterium sp. J372]MCR5862478.1 endonuclease [Flavobacterium sp. J372]